MPDLPRWIHLVYNQVLKIGFLFGTPPNDVKSVKLDVVAYNQYTFETFTKQITLDVYSYPDPVNSQLKMKIHNLNLEDLMDDSKRERLLDIFRTVLWPESAADLHLVELHSALAAGGRRPARRTDGEGVILTLGSQAEFPEILRDLEREVSPLWTSRNCPRDFKKTSAERHFRTKGFLMDWCSFKLVLGIVTYNCHCFFNS
uniref:EOG090X04W0 n=1 Tax=Alona affinis TaxID=381656 RepID=A0A9N6WQV1_9CRUS|nr:EOG090X04W0 [Alona affinis]